MRDRAARPHGTSGARAAGRLTRRRLTRPSAQTVCPHPPPNGQVHNGLDRSGPPEPGEESVEVRAHSGYGDITINRAYRGAT